MITTLEFLGVVEGKEQAGGSPELSVTPDENELHI